MAYDASPPIISKYTRQLVSNTRPRTPRRSEVADGLEESSLAVWWDLDKTINLNNNTTPFRKQQYEPLKWANAHLLLDEDGGEFLADDPFATPAPVVKSAKKAISARKRGSNGAGGHSRRSSRMSVASHRTLTLADLTPKSRRLSGFRSKTPQRPKSSDPNARSFRLSFNDPAPTQTSHRNLEVIEEHQSRQKCSPLLSPFRPLTPKYLLQPRSSPVTPQHIRRRHSNASPIKAVTPAIIHDPPPSGIRDSVDDTEQGIERAKVGVLTVGPSEPIRDIPDDGADEEDEDLHKSIPGAFDFVPFERFQPQPAPVRQKFPSTCMNLNKLSSQKIYFKN